jgi:hypothetical protein
MDLLWTELIAAFFHRRSQGALEEAFHLAERNAILRALRSSQAGHNRAQIQLYSIGKKGIRAIIRPE